MLERTNDELLDLLIDRTYAIMDRLGLIPPAPPQLEGVDLRVEYVSLMSQFVGFFFWNRGLALGGVARTGQLQLLQPFVTLAAAALLLGEDVGWRHAGFAAAVIGIVMLGRLLRVKKASNA